MALMYDGSYSSDWWLIDHAGKQWTLYGGGAQGEEGVTLESITGVSSAVDREMASTITQIGEDIAGESIPAINPTMTVNVHERQRPGAWEAWQSAISSRQDGYLFYSGLPGKKRSLRVRGTGEVSDPEADPLQIGMIQQQVPLLGLDGCWLGEEKEFATGRHSLNIVGDLPATFCVDYTQAGALALSIAGRSWTAPLPAPGSGKTATTLLDPAQMMKTLIAGEPIPALWATFRNHWNPLALAPGSVVHMMVPAGAKVCVQQRYLTPWH